MRTFQITFNRQGHAHINLLSGPPVKVNTKIKVSQVPEEKERNILGLIPLIGTAELPENQAQVMITGEGDVVGVRIGVKP